MKVCCTDTLSCAVYMIYSYCDCADDPERVGVSLEDVLVFLTGESAIPAIGFDTTPKV